MAFLRWSLLLASLYLAAFNVWAQEHIRLAPGDDKTNYNDVDYKTDSLSLEQRIGRPADLLKIARSQQMGLPPLFVPKNNAPDSGKISLILGLFEK